MKHLRRVVAVLLCAALLAGCDTSGAPAAPSAAPQPTAGQQTPAETAYPAPADSAYPGPTPDAAYPAPQSEPAYPAPQSETAYPAPATSQ